MRLKLELMQLHEPLFLAGVNFGNKLIPKSGKGDLQLFYDTDLKLGIVIFKETVAIIENVGPSTLSNPKDIGIEVKKLNVVQHHDQRIAPIAVKAQIGGPNEVKRTAQVSTPMDKVQGGKVLKKAKFQGEESQGE